jgi:ferredoxin
MKVKVTGVCQGHARCAALAPHIFKLDDEGFIQPQDIEVGPQDEALARRAVRACPERALSIEPD